MGGTGSGRWDPRELLCERCGYSIEGLDEEGDCPECGEPVRESLPERRVGSAWQRRADAIGLARASLEVLGNPRRCFRRVAIEDATIAALLWRQLSVASALGSLAIVGGVSGSMLRQRISPSPGSWSDVIAWALLVPIVMFTLWVLTVIEQRGIRFFGARNGYRITRRVSRVVGAHAASGWVLAGALMVAGWAIGEMIYGIARAGDGPISWFEWWSPLLLQVPGFVAGFLVFECLAYLGMRGCRYANRPRLRLDESPTASPASRSASP